MNAMDSVGARPQHRVAFVYTREVSSSTYRGLLVARALNQTFLKCKDLTSGRAGQLSFDVIVHLKLPCAHAFAHGAHHVIDHIDALPDRYASFRSVIGNFSGQMFNTDIHLREQCCTRVCAVVPHHCNLPCNSSLDRNGPHRVGLIGWTQASLLIGHELTAGGIRAESEPKGRWHTFGYGRDTGRPAEICRFFDRLSVAIAWNEEQDGYDPGQRFTNPICLGIPTIGYARQPSFRAHDGSSRFLCDDVDCVRRLIEQIHRGSLRNEFFALSRNVREHVGWAATRRRYLSVFEAVLSRGQRVRRLFGDAYQNDIADSPRCHRRPDRRAGTRWL